MQLEFLGGAAEIGRSALLVDDTLLIDYGTKPGNPPSFPTGLSPGSGPAIEPEAVVVSHGHLDHVGAVPTLCAGTARPPIHWTPPTAALARTLARDTLRLHGGSYDCPFTAEEVARLAEVSVTHSYGESFDVAGYEVTLFDAGHIPGSAHVLVDDGETRMLYTGDFHTHDQRLVAGTTARPPADVVVCESTYADRTHPDRAGLERQFVDRVRTTLAGGGTAVIPAFAIGRTQELMLICAAHDIPCYVDGMGQAVTRLFQEHEAYVRDPSALRRAAAHARFVDGRDGQRERIAAQPVAIVTTSGMLQGGPAMTYVPAVRSNPANLVALTGYQVAGTPGRELLETGRAPFDGRVLPVGARVESFDFSAHADRAGLERFLDDYRDASVLVVHGDDTAGFAAALRADDVDASAPAVGETVTVGGSPR